MIYLDNSSTTHTKPKCVIKATLKGVTKYSVNSSRGGYDLAIQGGIEVLKTRESLANLFNIDSDNVIFTSSCTEAINLALKGTAKPGGHIVSTMMEHNSTLRTLNDLEKEGITYTLVKPNKKGVIDANDIENAIRPNTYLISVIHTSNVTGATNDISKIGKIAKKHNLLYMVDGAQSTGHVKVDIKKDNINLFSIAGHKGLYAPQGIGALITNDVSLKPLITGGTGTFSESIVQPTSIPEGMESGTLNMPGILGLKAGTNFVMKHFDKINNRIKKLTTILYEYLKHKNNIVLYSSNIESGVMSFNVKGYTSSEIGDILSGYNICVRTGLHCAPLIHQVNGTLQTGMVRVSLGYYNKLSDIRRLIKVLDNIN